MAESGGTRQHAEERREVSCPYPSCGQMTTLAGVPPFPWDTTCRWCRRVMTICENHACLSPARPYLKHCPQCGHGQAPAAATGADPTDTVIDLARPPRLFVVDDLTRPFAALHPSHQVADVLGSAITYWGGKLFVSFPPGWTFVVDPLTTLDDHPDPAVPRGLVGCVVPGTGPGAVAASMRAVPTPEGAAVCAPSGIMLVTGRDLPDGPPAPGAPLPPIRGKNVFTCPQGESIARQPLRLPDGSWVLVCRMPTGSLVLRLVRPGEPPAPDVVALPSSVSDPLPDGVDGAWLVSEDTRFGVSRTGGVTETRLSGGRLLADPGTCVRAAAAATSLFSVALAGGTRHVVRIAPNGGVIRLQGAAVMNPLFHAATHRGVAELWVSHHAGLSSFTEDGLTRYESVAAIPGTVGGSWPVLTWGEFVAGLFFEEATGLARMIGMRRQAGFLDTAPRAASVRVPHGPPLLRSRHLFMVRVVTREDVVGAPPRLLLVRIEFPVAGAA